MGTETAYEEIRKVVEETRYFFKVKKYAIKRIAKMAFAHSSQSISSERYLLDTIKRSRYDQKLNCYRSNSFDDIPEYYLIKHCIKYSSRPREEHAKGQDEVILVDSSRICDAILRLLRENDSSHSRLDDSFYLKTVYESLGKAATYAMLPGCLNEFRKCLKIEKIAPSYSHARAIGAVKGFAYLHIAKPETVEHALRKELAGRVAEIDQLLKLIEDGIRCKVATQAIYAMDVKKIFYRQDFLKALKEALGNAERMMSTGKAHRATSYLAEVLKRVHKICKKSVPEERELAADFSLVELLWSFLSHPFGNISIDYLHTLKQMYWLVFREKVPRTHRESHKSLCPEVLDEEWMQVVSEDFDFAVDLEKEERWNVEANPKEKNEEADSPKDLMAEVLM